MKRAIALLVLQAGVILGWAGYHAAVRASAPTFRVRLDPRDPYDLLRGRYFVLNPADAVLDPHRLDEPSWKALSRGRTSFAEDALVGFCPDGDVYRVCALRPPDSPATGPAAFWARAFVNDWGNGNVRIDLGLHRFFIPNRAELPQRRDGWELQVSYRPGQRLLPRRLWHDGTPLDLR